MLPERLTSSPTKEQINESEKIASHYVPITEMVEQAGGQGSRDFGGPFSKKKL